MLAAEEGSCVSLRQLTVKYMSLLGFSLPLFIGTERSCCSLDPLPKILTSTSLEKPKLQYFPFPGNGRFFIHKALPINLDRRVILLEEVFKRVRQLVSFGRNVQMSVNSFSA